MSSAYQGLLVVIPTRNRAQLAIAAARSVLAQPDCAVRVLLSDNSTATQEADELAQFCAQLADPRLRYVRPPQSLPMTEHWDWALQQALQVTEVNHFIYLTDRTIMKPGALSNVAQIVAAYPTQVVAYNFDTILDHLRPIRLEQQVWSGALLTLSATHLLFLSSRMIIPNYLPRMLNSCAPRGLLEAIRARYGNVFASIAPDYNFCYRCLEMVDSILYYDQAVMLSYALHRSNGVSQMRGLATKDHVDFMASLGTTQFNFAAPLPAFKTIRNTMIHEYAFVQQQTGSPKLPEIDYGQYLTYLCHDVAQIEEPQLRREMEALITAHGFAWRARLLGLRRRLALGVKVRRILGLLRGTTTAGAQPAQLEFAQVEEALAYALKSPRPRASTTAHLQYLMGTVVPTPPGRATLAPAT